MHPAQPVDMSATAAHQRPEFLLAGRGIKLRMKIIVARNEALEVSGLGELLLEGDRVVEAYDQGFAVLLREQPDDFELQRLAQEMGLLGPTDVDAADDGGVLRKHVDQPFFLEPHQGVADRRRADAELCGEIRARQRRARRQFERENGIAQPLEYLRCGLPGPVEPRAGAGGYAGRGFGWFHAKRSGQLAFRYTNALVH